VSTEPSTFMPVCSSAIADAEAALDLEDELEHVDRVESQAFAEERRRVADLVSGNRKPETANDRLLDLGLEGIGRCSHEGFGVRSE
jgi:hypothetical protein